MPSSQVLFGSVFFSRAACMIVLCGSLTLNGSSYVAHAQQTPTKTTVTITSEPLQKEEAAEAEEKAEQAEAGEEAVPVPTDPSDLAHGEITITVLGAAKKQLLAHIPRASLRSGYESTIHSLLYNMVAENAEGLANNTGEELQVTLVYQKKHRGTWTDDYIVEKLSVDLSNQNYNFFSIGEHRKLLKFTVHSRRRFFSWNKDTDRLVAMHIMLPGNTSDNAIARKILDSVVQSSTSAASVGTVAAIGGL